MLCHLKLSTANDCANRRQTRPIVVRQTKWRQPGCQATACCRQSQSVLAFCGITGPEILIASMDKQRCLSLRRSCLARNLPMRNARARTLPWPVEGQSHVPWENVNGRSLCSEGGDVRDVWKTSFTRRMIVDTTDTQWSEHADAALEDQNISSVRVMKMIRTSPVCGAILPLLRIHNGLFPPSYAPQ